MLLALVQAMRLPWRQTKTCPLPLPAGRLSPTHDMHLTCTAHLHGALDHILPAHYRVECPPPRIRCHVTPKPGQS
jgi:hypothetical protein